MTLGTEPVSTTAIRLAVEWLAANANGVSLVDWEPRSQTLLSAADEIERLRGALLTLLPGLVLDLRYADLDDKDAMRSRIKTVEEALS